MEVFNDICYNKTKIKRKFKDKNMRTKWKRYKKPRNERVGNMFFTLSIISLILGILPILSTIAAAFYYLFAGILILLTLGLLLLNEDFKASFASGEQVFKNLGTLISYSPYILGVAAVFAFISTIIYAKSKTLLTKGGNVTAGIIFTIIPIVVAIFISKL